MSRATHLRFFLASGALWLGTAVALSIQASAQTATHLRAVAVYEYVGSLSKPTASRLVPITIWDGSAFQPASLYLADPEPLAVERGTLYELMQDGVGIGQIEVEQAQAEQSAEHGLAGWTALGRYLPNPAPEPMKLKLPAYLAQSSDFAPEHPHFAYIPPKSTGVAGGIAGAPSQSTAKSAPAGAPQAGDALQPGAATPADEGRPILHAPPEVSPQAPPTLHRPTQAEAPQTGTGNGAGSGFAVLSERMTMPGRPHLFYGKPQTAEAVPLPQALTGRPADMKQRIAISDPSGTVDHSYAWSWPSLEDESRTQAALGALALRELAAHPVQTFGARQKSATAQEASSLMLAQEKLYAYRLSWGSGPVYVFSAQTSMQGGNGAQPGRYITLIARPDFNGSLILLFSHVTSEALLAYQPRMQLVGPVDATGQGYADLLFALLSGRNQQFALFRVGANEAVPVFTTTAE